MQIEVCWQTNPSGILSGRLFEWTGGQRLILHIQPPAGRDKIWHKHKCNNLTYSTQMHISLLGSCVPLSIWMSSHWRPPALTFAQINIWQWLHGLWPAIHPIWTINVSAILHCFRVQHMENQSVTRTIRSQSHASMTASHHVCQGI